MYCMDHLGIEFSLVHGLTILCSFHTVDSPPEKKVLFFNFFFRNLPKATGLSVETDFGNSNFSHLDLLLKPTINTRSLFCGTP